MREDIQAVLASPDVRPPWIVPGLLVQGALVVLAGEPGGGKTTLCYALSAAVACGVPFLGRDTHQTRVLYFDEENGPYDRRQYMKWAWRGLGSPTGMDNLTWESLTLTKAGFNWYDCLLDIVRRVKPGLIVLDTTTPACHVQDENDNAEATQVLSKLRYAASEASDQCALLLIRHARLEHETGKFRPRGATTWVAATDATFIFANRPGRAYKDGLRNTQIIPTKRRASGITEPLKIYPEWVGPSDARGLKLSEEVAEG